MVNSCLNDINIAFKWRKPEVVGTHRVNNIGGLDSTNRQHGLLKLVALLKDIHKRWPDVEFMTSTELGDLITNGHQCLKE